MIIIIALALGVVAAVSTVLYVNSAQSRANNNAKLVAVYVINKPIAKGATGDVAISSGAIKRSSIPRQFFPATAVVDLNEIKGKVTPAQLAPGQVLVADQFVEPSVADTSFSGTSIPAGQVAVTVTLPPAQAAAGLIVPGDKVDLMAIIQPTDKSGAPIPPAASTKYAHFFYQNVNVIAIGTAAAPTQGQTTAPAANGTSSSLYTFAVPPEAAERILLASTSGTIYAALVPPDNQPVNVPVVSGGAIDSANNVVANPPALTPYGQ